MNTLVSICLLWLNTNMESPAMQVDLEYVREHYEKATSDKEICKKLITELSESKGDVHLAYLGAFQTIWANHVFNPINKLSTFREGKTNIEKAVLQSADNAEIRFIRLSVQQNCPRFLGYHDHLIEDKEYLAKHKNTIHSPVVLKMVNDLLSE